jgi:hypothetical protein
MSSTEFIKKHGFEELDKIYGNPISLATGFVESKKLNVFYYLAFIFCSITKSYIINPKPLIEKISKGYKDKIKIGTVFKVSKNKNATFRVRTSIGVFEAKNVVFAAPQKSLKGVYNLPKPNLQQPAYVFYVKGIRKKIYKDKKSIVFQPKKHDISMIWGQKNGVDVIYTLNRKPDFGNYYKEYHLLTSVYRDPAMIIPKGKFIEQKLNQNLYLASDYNISFLEDSFLTGLYAANQIILNQKN